MVLLSVLLSGTATAADPYTDQQLLVETEGYQAIHPGELTILKQASPDFPSKAHKQGHRHEECIAQVFVGDNGKPESSTVQGCPEVFHRSVQKAVKKWRIEPVIGEDGLPAPVTFVLRFRFEKA